MIRTALILLIPLLLTLSTPTAAHASDAASSLLSICHTPDDIVGAIPDDVRLEDARHDAVRYEDLAPRHSLVCGNIWVHADLVPMFKALLRSSPTVRRQIARIRRATRLTVSMTLSDECEISGARCHALTQFARYVTGLTIAQVRIQRETHLADAIGHELEHVCEWTEGALSRLRGLRRDGRDDTDRARLAGERVRQDHARWLRAQAHVTPMTTDETTR